MKTTIVKRLEDLGGKYVKTEGELFEKLQAVELEYCLYPKPEDTPWASADEQEPIYGLGDFVDENMELYNKSPDVFYQKMIDTYYPQVGMYDEPAGQIFWKCELFTPFTKDSNDYEEWKGAFEENKVKSQVKGDKLEFIMIADSYGYPDNLFVCVSDPNPDNPMIYGTDHEQYFSKISEQGTLEEFLNSMMTKEELLDIVKTAMNK